MAAQELARVQPLVGDAVESERIRPLARVHRPPEGDGAVFQVQVRLQLGCVSRRFVSLRAGDQDRELVVSDACDVAVRGKLRAEPRLELFDLAVCETLPSLEREYE